MDDAREKKPGFQLLREAAEAITRAPIGRLSKTQKERFSSDLEIQCFARENEIIPDDKREAVVGEVVKAVCAIHDEWPGTIANFVVSQIGEEAFGACIEEYGFVQIDCPKCDHHVLIVTPEIAEEYARRQAELKAHRSPDIDEAFLSDPFGLLNALLEGRVSVMGFTGMPMHRRATSRADDEDLSAEAEPPTDPTVSAEAIATGESDDPDHDRITP